jgi:hypothetical protein
MIKRILLALALAASLGGAVVACNTPAGTAAPTVGLPSTPASSDLLPSTPASSDMVTPSASDELSAEPSAS